MHICSKISQHIESLNAVTCTQHQPNVCKNHWPPMIWCPGWDLERAAEDHARHEDRGRELRVHEGQLPAAVPPPQQGGQAAQVPLNTHTNISFMFTRAVCYVNMSSYNLQSSQSSLNQIYCIDICAFSKSSLSLDTVSTKLIRVSWS